MLQQAPAGPAHAMPNPLLTIKHFHRRLGGAVGIAAQRAAVNAGRIRLGERNRLIPATEVNDWPARKAHQPQ